jgi:hypothetical protein
MKPWNKAQLLTWRVMLPMLIPVPVRQILILSGLVIMVMTVFYVASQQLLLQGQTAQKTIALHAMLAPQIKAKAKAKVSDNKSPKTKATKPPAIVSTASVMTELRTMARKNKLRIRELSTDVRQEQGGNWLSVEMEAQGSYSKIKSLIFGLQQRYSQLRMEKMRIEKNKRGSLSLWLRFSPGLLERG